VSELGRYLEFAIDAAWHAGRFALAHFQTGVAVDVKADASPGGQKSTASLLSFDQTLDAAGDSALFGTPDDIAAKLEMLRAAGIEHLLLNGPTGSRENLRAFARDIMPAFAGSAPAPRRQPQLATS